MALQDCQDTKAPREACLAAWQSPRLVDRGAKRDKKGRSSMHLLYGLLILGGMFFVFYLLGKDIEPREGG